VADVEHNAIRVSNVATRDRVVLFLDGAAGSYQPAFVSLNVGYEELEDRPMLFALFDVETKSARLESHESLAPVHDR